MKKSYTQTAGLTHRLRQLGLTVLLAGGATVAAHAQTLNYTIAGGTNTTTTYTDLGTTGTAITTANNDDANSAVQSIGFPFSYNGAVFTQFFLNTNGFIKLGATAPSATAMYPAEAAGSAAVEVFQSAADPNIIAPFNFDLAAGSAGGTEYRVYTSGTVGSRVCTIQWKNVADKSGTYLNQYGNMSFQTRLYEATGVVELVYGTATAGSNPDDFRSAEIGLKGTSFGTGQIVQVLKNSTDAWSLTSFQNYAFVTANQSLITTNFRKTVLPDAGRTFRFTPVAPPVTVVANDASVAAIYTLGKIITPQGLPHTVSALITNAGSTALTSLPVTLSVTGANTFTNTQTVASLAVGASTTVTFAAYPATLTAGTNTVTVTVPADGNTANNSASQSQLINATTLSYIAPDQTTATAGGVGFGTSAGILASKFTLSAAKSISSISVYLPNTSNLAGHTMYAVLLSSTGTILGQSANYVTTAADVNTLKVLPLATAVTVPAGDFYVGIAQVASATTFYPVGLQTETPTRTGAFYGFALTGGTPSDIASQNFGRFMIEAIATVTTATSPELMRAVTVYPNPSTSGVFNLAINGANAQKGLEVEVVNTLGQRVYAGTARDNFTTTLDLSNLANGLYHLKIKNGDEYMQRQLSVVK
jgi:hypothetical protein